jgi:hypothetical protein
MFGWSAGPDTRDDSCLDHLATVVKVAVLECPGVSCALRPASDWEQQR